MCFTLGFCLYSLIPGMRLVYAAHLANKAVEQVTDTKHKLYEMEAAATETGDHK